MTKANEIDVLKRAVVELGPDSYLGPWLKAALPAIEADIRSDFSPNVTLPNEANAEGTRIVEAAKRHALDIRAKAEQDAEAIIEKARKQVRDRSAALQQLMGRAAGELEQRMRF